MAQQYDVGFEYYLGSSPPTSTTVYNIVNPTPFGYLEDSADGTDDGDVAIGTGQVYYNNYISNVQLFGASPSGDPIVYVPSTNGYYLLSNNGALSGQIGTITQSGTFMFCFACGTLITTPHSEVAVEKLSIGDVVETTDGRAVPVKWIGRQTVHKLVAGPHMQPVRFRAGALGGGLPNADLTVTADHGMVIDGLVVNASALVNGSSIDFVPLDELPDRVTYYHIETEAHDVILANGAPAETFVDMPGRMAFDNYAEYLELYGAERIIPEMTLPRITSQRLLPQALKERIGLTEPTFEDLMKSA